MGKNLQKLYSFRTNEEMIKKIEYIGQQNMRNRNKQIEFLIMKCIEEYEAEHGEIKLSDND